MKRYHMKLKAILAAMVLLVASSCDNWLDDNINPNALPTVPVNQMLPSAIGSFGFYMGGSDLFRYSAIWSQQITAQAGRQTENYSLYVLADTELNGIWRTNLYAGILTDLEEMLKLDPAITHPRYFGIAKVLKAFTYSVIVDFWGDVPFTEAHQGVSNVTPAVDDDAAIYPALITLLDQAIVDLKASSSLAAPAGDDYIFSGNAARWIKTANVLKLRMYLKLANTPGFNTSAISSFITSTPATEFMESITDDMQHPFATVAQRQNPTHQFILSRTDDICSSSTLVNLMTKQMQLVSTQQMQAEKLVLVKLLKLVLVQVRKNLAANQKELQLQLLQQQQLRLQKQISSICSNIKKPLRELRGFFVL